MDRRLNDWLNTMTFEFSVIAPKGWKDIPLDTGSRSGEVKKLVQNVSPLANVQGFSPRLFQDFFESSLAQAWNTGSRLLIVSCPSQKDEFPLLASYTIGVLPLAIPKGSDEQNFEQLTTIHMNERADLFDGESLDIGSYQHTKLGKGVMIKAIRYARDEDLHPTSRKIATLRIFFIYRNRFIVLTGTTFQVEYADIIFRLFEKITDSVEVTYYQ